MASPWDFNLPTGDAGLLASLSPEPEQQAPQGLLQDPALMQALQSPTPPTGKQLKQAGVLTSAQGGKYQSMLDDMFSQNISKRTEQAGDLKERLASKLAEEPSKLQKMDLSAALAYADSLVGTRVAQSYKAPTAIADKKSAVENLQKEISANENAVADDQLGYLRIKAQEEAIRQASNRAAANADNKDTAEESRMRREYLSNPAVKGFNDVDGSYQAIASNPATDGPSQQAFVYQFSKLLDPGSVVRETEYAMSAANAGKINQALQYANSLAEGKPLTPQQIAQMKQVADGIMQSYRAKVDGVNKYYSGIAQRKGFRPEDVVADTYAMNPRPASMPAAVAPGKGAMSFEEWQQSRRK